jgi:hypothetical protein
MAKAAPAAGGGIADILVTRDRDFLVRNSGEQVSQPPHLFLSRGLFTPSAW